MIISKTPFRMSFFGGGTDIPDYFNKNKGAVLSTTFDKYCYVITRHLPRFFSYENEFVYSQIERVNEINDINHPLIRNAMNMLDMYEIRASYEADLPAKSGLGTSSSFAVGLLNTFHCLKKENTNKRQLADEAIYLERTLCNESGGWQDQIAASYGGFNRIDFYDNSYNVTPLNISEIRKKQLNDNLLMFFTGYTRISSEIQKINNIADGSKEEHLKEMYHLVDIAQSILEDDNKSINEFGELLGYSWDLKKKTGKAVSNNNIDEIYDKAIDAGAIGGKLLGAGGGGFLVLYVEKDKQRCVKDALSNLMCIPFEFENNGTQIIYNVHETFEER